MRLNNKGFTIIEIMIATGLSTLVILGLMHTSKIMLDIKKHNDQNFNITSTLDEVSITLNKEPVCTSFNLDQVVFDPSQKIELTELKLNANKTILSVNDQISNNLSVTKIYVDGFNATQSNATYTDYIANLNIEFKRDSGIGGQQITKQIPVNIIAENISINQSKAIKCRAKESIENANMIMANNDPTQNFEQATCALFGGTFNSNTQRCENVQMQNAQSPDNNQLRCGHCLQGGGATSDIPCMGSSLCGPSGSCPANFQLIHLQGQSTSIGVGSEKYCQPI